MDSCPDTDIDPGQLRKTMFDVFYQYATTYINLIAQQQ